VVVLELVKPLITMAALEVQAVELVTTPEPEVSAHHLKGLTAETV